MTSTQTTTLTGTAAIDYAAERDLSLCTYTDPTADGREDVSVDEAREIAAIDPGLVYLEVEVEEYVDVRHSDSWGLTADRISDEEHADACQRMEDYLTDHEGEAISISVRPSRRGEVDGLFRVIAGARRLVTSEERARLHELLGAAWQHACETWPMVEAAR